MEFFSVLNFVYDKDVEDLRSSEIIGFEPLSKYFDPVDREVETESVKPCNDAQSCLSKENIETTIILSQDFK